MKKLALLFGLFFTIMFAVESLASVKPPMENFYANDYANVLSRETIDYIISENDRISGTGAEIVVVTVDFTDGQDIGSYSLEMFNNWGIGDSEKNNGLLLLLSIGDDDYRITSGDGIDRYLDAGTLQDIQDQYLEPDFAAENYDAGVRKTFDALCAQVERIYVSGNGNVNSNAGSAGYRDDYNSDSVSGLLPSGFFVVIVFIFLVLLISVTGRVRTRYYPDRPWYYFGRRRHHHHHHHHHPPVPPPRRHRGFGGGSFGSGDGFGGARGGGGMSRGSGASRSNSSRGGSSFGSGAGRSNMNRGGGGAKGGGGMSRGSGAGRRK